MRLKSLFKPSKEKLILLGIILIMSFIFLITKLIPLAIYTDWILVIVVPILKILKIQQLGSGELLLFFGGILFSGYIMACFIIEKKEMLRNFFQPNKLKLVLFIVIILLANIPTIGTLDTGEQTPSIGLHAGDTAIGSSTFYSLNPVLWLPYWYSVSFIDSTQLDWGFYWMLKDTIPAIRFLSNSSLYSEFAYSLPSMIFYWYMLSCLIYFGYTKIRKPYTRNSTSFAFSLM